MHSSKFCKLESGCTFVFGPTTRPTTPTKALISPRGKRVNSWSVGFERTSWGQMGKVVCALTFPLEGKELAPAQEKGDSGRNIKSCFDKMCLEK